MNILGLYSNAVYTKEDDLLIFGFNYVDAGNFQTFDILLTAIYYNSEDLAILGIEELLEDDPNKEQIRPALVNKIISQYHKLYPVLKPHIDMLVKHGNSIVIDIKPLGSTSTGIIVHDFKF